MYRKTNMRPLTLALAATGILGLIPLAHAGVTAQTRSARVRHKTNQQSIAVGEVSSNVVTQSAYAQHTPELPKQKHIFKSGISS